MHDPDDDDDDALCCNLAARFERQLDDVQHAYTAASRNVCTVLRRQHINTVHPTSEHPLCKLLFEEALVRRLGLLPLEVGFLTLARVYDECHVALCKTLAAARRGRPHNELFRHKPCVNLRPLTDRLDQHRNDQIILEATSNEDVPMRAVWKPVLLMSFDQLPSLRSFSNLLPGEKSPSHEYAGVGGGGGSDIISASLLGHLLRRHNKQMELLVSTRTWATGSQGKKGSKLGIKREVYQHDGPALGGDGRPVPGTFRVKTDTYAEGRDLETIPLQYHRKVFMVLDQGESASDIPEGDRAELKDQFQAVLAQAAHSIKTVLIVDTGGDVFGADKAGGTTPDQDFRVQKAMASLSPIYNLVTAVVAPGVDAPEDAPDIASKAGGMVYKPTPDEQTMLLDLLINKYKMDGSDPSRFGKTILALQARLKGIVGWTSLDLPPYVVDTWDNPWNSFVYIQGCMSDIILMPTIKLLPLIEPKKQEPAL
ncbi:hypothetical protein LTR47_002589 [Exophiala xenobiotica]|nr:hypothetical protein LTR47_002589 [Exophiala xenobiotica]KAK5251259.1 hypothetical protein LTS06_004016 [Exophiala xenobiotica]KAK5323419.1 hypothetical protein LTR93_005473 [Exophiala xenobiotica]KAK5350744.1 hypothetical protein LTR61_005942 [Exophiala xenobiotica]KAK5377841.1 hypothetical protein LTS03_004716 [Exophiala xenobiotica]